MFSVKQEAGLAAEIEDGGWRIKCYRYEERYEMVSQDSERQWIRELACALQAALGLHLKFLLDCKGSQSAVMCFSSHIPL